MTDLIKFEPIEEMPNIIKVIGVGGGGSNAVTHMFTEGIQGVDFILCNTDHQALEKSPVATKIHLGKRALGAGNVPAVGRDAAMETMDELRDILSKDTKMLFITAGMGGGTGTGAAPVVASIARELDILTVGIVTLPFSCEGKRRQQQAYEGIVELKKHVDALLVISNDKLRDVYGDMKLTHAFKKADDVLKTAAKGIAEIITVTGYVNVDFQDVNTVMKNSGKAIMGSGYAEGDERALKAVEEAVHSPLLDDSDIKGAKNILVYITSGTDEVSLDEVMTITDYVQETTGNCADVIWGNGEDQSMGNGINVTIIATGFEENDTREKKIYEVDKLSCLKNVKRQDPEHEHSPSTLEQEHKQTPENNDSGIHVINKKKEEEEESAQVPVKEPGKKNIHFIDDYYQDDSANDALPRNGGTSSERTVTVESPTTRVYNNPFGNDDEDEDLQIRTYSTKDAAETQTMVKHETKKDTSDMSQQEMLRRKRLASLNMNFRTMSNIEQLENQPAYKRMGVNINTNTDNQELSSYSSNIEKGLRENNSYLHDNVD